MRSFITLLLALSLPFYTLAAHGSRRHDSLARRARGDVLERRGGYTGVRLTYYYIEVGITACGGRYLDSDFVVALNVAMFGPGYPGKRCGDWITLTVNGKTANVQVVDECEACPRDGGLDLTVDLFQYFGSLSLGVMTGSWVWADGSGGGEAPPATTHHTPTPTPKPQAPSPTPTPKPTTSSTPPPPPTTSTTHTSKEPSPTTSTTPTTTSTTHHTHPHSSSTPSTSSSSTPTPTPTFNDQSQNLEGLSELFNQYAGIVQHCIDE